MLSRLFYFGGYDWFGPIIKIQDVICCEGPARGDCIPPSSAPRAPPDDPPRMVRSRRGLRDASYINPGDTLFSYAFSPAGGISGAASGGQGRICRYFFRSLVGLDIFFIPWTYPQDAATVTGSRDLSLAGCGAEPCL